MYKKILAGMMVATMMMTVGCGKGADEKTPVTLDPIAVADSMMEVFQPQGEMLELTPDTISNYYDIDTEKVVNYKVYMSSSFIGEEIAVFEVVDGVDLNAVLEQRLQDMKDSFEGYLPEELDAVNNTGEMIQNGNLVCLIVGDNEGSQGAKDIFSSAQGKEDTAKTDLDAVAVTE